MINQLILKICQKLRVLYNFRLWLTILFHLSASKVLLVSMADITLRQNFQIQAGVSLTISVNLRDAKNAILKMDI